MGKAKGSVLTDKQLLFCQYYIVNLNATEAAKKAGYSDKTSYSHGQRLLKNDEIQNEIQKSKTKRAEKVECTSDMVLAELKKIGFSDLKEYLNTDYSLKPLDQLKDTSVIASIQTDETQGEGWTNKTVKFKLHDKLRALENIAKHIGFFEKDNEQLSDKSTFNIGFGKKSD